MGGLGLALFPVFWRATWRHESTSAEDADCAKAAASTAPVSIGLDVDEPDANEPDADEPDADEPDADAPEANELGAKEPPFDEFVGGGQAGCLTIVAVVSFGDNDDADVKDANVFSRWSLVTIEDCSDLTVHFIS